MPMGKGEPYETDVRDFGKAPCTRCWAAVELLMLRVFPSQIRLPMYVTGPDIPKNVTMLHPTTHLDITATIVELAAANVYAPQLLDGER